MTSKKTQHAQRFVVLDKAYAAHVSGEVIDVRYVSRYSVAGFCELQIGKTSCMPRGAFGRSKFDAERDVAQAGGRYGIGSWSGDNGRRHRTF
jgi:hypothetical protein